MDENNRQPFEEENTEAASEAPEAAPETAEPKPEELLGEEFIFLGSHATQKEEKITRIEKATKPKKRKKKKGCLRRLVYFSVILVVSVALALVIFRWAGDYLGLMKPDREVDVTIAKGSSTKQIAETLKENDIIRSPLAFRLYAKFTGVDGTFTYGTMQLNSKWGYDDIIEVLQDASAVKDDTVEITIPEGWTYSQIITELEKKGVSTEAKLKKEMADYTADFDFLSGLPQNDKILYKYEGYLFPAKYDFYLEEAPSSVYERMLSKFDEVWSKYEARAKEMGMSMDEVITLASIIQREAGDEAQMKMVSSVFHNRLKEGSPFPRLESDVTVWYPYYRKDQVPESILPGFKSNYNTYRLEGLPPGPICCPGEAAIDAALNPAESEYYFFVTDVKNNYYYAVTFEEHVKNCKKAAKVGTLGGTAVEE